MADDVLRYLEQYGFPADVNTPAGGGVAPAAPARPVVGGPRVVDAQGQFWSIGDRVQSQDGLHYELGDDGAWHPVGAEPSPSFGSSVMSAFKPNIVAPFPEAPWLQMNENSPIPSPVGTLYKAARDTVAGIGSLPGDIAGFLRGGEGEPTIAEDIAARLRGALPPVSTGHTGTDIAADVTRFAVPGMGVANRAATITQGAPAAVSALAQILGAALSDAAVARPDQDTSIGDLVGAGPTQTATKETPAGKRLAIGAEAGSLSALAEGVLAALGVVNRGRAPVAPAADDLHVTIDPSFQARIGTNAPGLPSPSAPPPDAGPPRIGQTIVPPRPGPAGPGLPEPPRQIGHTMVTPPPSSYPIPMGGPVRQPGEVAAGAGDTFVGRAPVAPAQLPPPRKALPHPDWRQPPVNVLPSDPYPIHPPTATDDMITGIIRREGGYVDNPNDRGGKTKFGITERSWRDAGKTTPVSDITPAEARTFYRRYLADAGVDQVPAVLRDEFADAAVHHGPANAKRMLQQAVAGGGDVEAGFRNARKEFMRDIVAKDPTQSEFLDGWLRRADEAGNESADVATSAGKEGRQLANDARPTQQAAAERNANHAPQNPPTIDLPGATRPMASPDDEIQAPRQVVQPQRVERAIEPLDVSNVDRLRRGLSRTGVAYEGDATYKIQSDKAGRFYVEKTVAGRRKNVGSPYPTREEAIERAAADIGGQPAPLPERPPVDVAHHEAAIRQAENDRYALDPRRQEIEQERRKLQALYKRARTGKRMDEIRQQMRINDDALANLDRKAEGFRKIESDSKRALADARVASVPPPDGSRFGQAIHDGQVNAAEHTKRLTEPSPAVLLQIYGKIAQDSPFPNADRYAHDIMGYFSHQAPYKGALTSEDLADNLATFADDRASKLRGVIHDQIRGMGAWEPTNERLRSQKRGQAKKIAGTLDQQAELADFADWVKPGAGQRLREAVEDLRSEVQAVASRYAPSPPHLMSLDDFVESRGGKPAIGKGTTERANLRKEHADAILEAARRGEEPSAEALKAYENDIEFQAEYQRIASAGLGLEPIEAGPSRTLSKAEHFSPAPPEAGKIRGTPGGSVDTKPIRESSDTNPLTARDAAPEGQSIEKALDEADARRNARVPSKELKKVEGQIGADLKRKLDELAANAESDANAGKLNYEKLKPTVPVTVKHATGGETRYEIPYDAEKIRAFSKRVTKGGMFYSNPFLNPALWREMAPEMVNGLVSGIVGNYQETGQFGFDPKWGLAGAFATTALMHVPIAGKTILGKGSHAVKALHETIPNAMAKTKVTRWFHPTDGIMPDLYNRVMKAQQEMAALRSDIAVHSEYLRKHFTPAERSLMSDWIEKTDFPGGNHQGGFRAAAQRVKDEADALSTRVHDVGQELVNLGMLDKEAFDRWGGQYLARYFQKWEGDAAKAGTATRTGVEARWARARGTFKELSSSGAERLSLAKGDKLVQMVDPTNGKTKYVSPARAQTLEQQGWTKGHTWEKSHIDGDHLVVWRDWTPHERAAWGEIRDANYRFTKGMMAASRDIALGRMMADVASNPEWASKTQKAADWVQLPAGYAQGTRVKRYGKLAGMWVHPDVDRALRTTVAPWWDRITDEHVAQAMRNYKTALSAWKVGKTAYNPATWFNNFTSNIAMSSMAGDIGPVDFVRGLVALNKKDPRIAEGVKAGLSIDVGNARIGDALSALQADLVTLQAKPMAAWSRIGAGMLRLFVDNKITRGYNDIDKIFKVSSYIAQRAKGMSPEQAVENAHRWYFDYGRAPVGVKAMRDFYQPFISYFYHVVPAMAEIAATKPHRLAAAFGLVSGMGMYAYGKLYPNNPLNREEFEREVLPRYLKGDTAIGTPKVVRLPYNEKEPNTGRDMAAFINSRYFMPGGDLLDFTNNSGLFGDVWPAVLGGTPFGGNPFVNTIVGMASAKDPFFAKEIMPYPRAGIFDGDSPGWQRIENAKAMAKWLAYQWLPPIASWHPDKIGNALVGDGTVDKNGPLARFMGWTGTDYVGRQISVERALLGMMGIKIETLDTEQAVKDANVRGNVAVGEAKKDLRSAARDQRNTAEEVAGKRQALKEAQAKAREDRKELMDMKRKADGK